MKDHWNRVYSSSPVGQLGWYEDEPTLSLEMIDRCPLGEDDPILDVGAGATTLIDHLVERGYQNVIALDISEVALEKLRERLGEKKASQVKWLVEDITDPDHVFDFTDVELWHDRAVLHFLTEEVQQQAYLSAMKKVLKDGGHAIIACFARGGATRCSGLDVKRYDAESLEAFLGDAFELKESQDYLYHMPSGDIRPYVYARFQKVG